MVHGGAPGSEFRDARQPAGGSTGVEGLNQPRAPATTMMGEMRSTTRQKVPGSIAVDRTPIPAAVERLRLFTISVALTVVMVLQDAGRLATDTKLDLVVDPRRFLSQALSLWDPLGEGGRIQNQAYGYLFPMGPFFALARALNFPPWATQRLWESSLLIAAFIGMFLVARALGVKAFWPAVAAGLSFALTPRVLSQLAFNSAELLPTMVLPWVLLPLVHGAKYGSPRRAAALSGIALLLAGGTNAGATLAILPVPIFWLLTRERGPRRTALIRWCALALPLATIWWVIPLLLLGRYSPPFLEWIEAAENTTVATSLFAALRGVPHWVSYLGSGYWPAGWAYAVTPSIIVATVAIAAAGLAGLVRRDTPHRLFLFVCLGLGLVGITFGHSSPVGPVFPEFARTLLDGPLVPFRNVHKFQGLVTLPLAGGLGFALERLRAPAAAPNQVAARFRLVASRMTRWAVALFVGALAIGPALGNDLVSAARDQPVAQWWEGASHWLAANSDGSRALIVPGAPFPTYLWGETVDDAIQPVARSPWVVRSAVPLAQPGLIRLLDVVEWRLASGRPDPSLASLLARSGIRYVVIRHDLNSMASDAVPQSLVRTTLEASPGFERAVGLGPRIGEQPNRGWLVDGGAGGARPAIEIYEVGGESGPVTLLSAIGTIRSNGSSDSLVTLVDAGLPQTTPVLFGSDGLDLDLGATITVATDGIRRQQDAFGGPFRRSGTMTASASYLGDRNTFDYLPDEPGPSSTFRYVGVEEVGASSSGADVRAVFNADPAQGPWSALDGDSDSVWRTAAWHGAVGEWIEVRFTEPVDVGTIRVAFAEGFRPGPSRIEITTDSESDVVSVRSTASPQTIPVPAGETTTLRLTVRAVEGGGPGGSIGIAALIIPGVQIERTMDVPDVGSPTVLRFAVAPGYRSDCLTVSGSAFCDPELASRGEEDDSLDRAITLNQFQAYDVAATVRLLPGERLDRLLDVGLSVDASATSVDSLDPRHRAGAAVDGDPTTAWVASPDDESPRLTLDLGEVRRVDALRLVVDPAVPAARPRVVWVHAGDQDWIGPVPGDGLIRLTAPATTDTVEITVVETVRRQSISMFNRIVRDLPVGISEVRFDPAIGDAAVPAIVEFDCDAGLEAIIDGAPIRFAVSAARSDVLAGIAVQAEPCDDATVQLRPGEHRFTLAGTSWAAPLTLELAKDDAFDVNAPAGDLMVEEWDATSRRVRVDADETSILVVHENFNDGWTAQLDGRELEAVRVDGWQQGFVVPTGAAGVVVMSYEPQRALIGGLAVGALGVPALFALALVRPSRRTPGAVHERGMSVRVGIVATLGTAALLAGPVGAAAVGTALLVGYWVFDAAPRALSFAGPALLATAGMIVAASDSAVTQADAPAVQTMCVTAVAVSFASGWLRASRDP